MVRHSRRGFLRLGAAAGLGAVSGCLGSGAGPSTSGTVGGHPMFGVDAARSGNNPDEDGPGGSVGTFWETDLDDQPVRSPAVVDGTVYACTEAGTVYAVDARSGETEWSVTLSEERRAPPTPPAVGHGSVFVGGSEGTFYAMDPGSGETNWRVDRFVPSPPAVVDGTVFVSYAGREETGVLALDAGDGAERWRCETVERAGSVAVSRDSVCLGGAAGFVYGIDRATGEETWRFDTNQWQPTTWAGGDTPVLADGRVYASNENFVLSLSASTGAERWHTGLPMLSASPALSGGKLYLVGTDAENQEVLFALDAATGRRRWRYEPPFVIGGGGTSPTVVGSTVYAGVGPKLVAVDADTGEERWQFEAEERVSGSPAVVDGVVYVGDASGRLYALA